MAAMESIDSSWKPVYNLFEEEFCRNTGSLRNLPIVAEILTIFIHKTVHFGGFVLPGIGYESLTISVEKVA